MNHSSLSYIITQSPYTVYT